MMRNNKETYSRRLCPLTFQLPAMMGCRMFNSVVVLLVVGALLLLMVLKAFALPQRAAVARRKILILDSFIADCRGRWLGRPQLKLNKLNGAEIEMVMMLSFVVLPYKSSVAWERLKTKYEFPRRRDLSGAPVPSCACQFNQLKIARSINWATFLIMAPLAALSQGATTNRA